MTREALSDIEITTADEFPAALQTLVENAVLEDVDVSDTWEFYTRGSIHNWEVEIVELDKEFTDEDSSVAHD